ncbi:MAG: aldehyde dehydrogenase [Pseudomonadales bacterium]|nr:aldehyde dehydrogenase [Pseudomonadales bacterium]
MNGNASPSTKAQWLALKETLHIENRPFINGCYQSVEALESIKVVNPADGSCITEVFACGQAALERAVLAARESFDSGVWSSLPPVERKKRLLALSRLIYRHRDELALLESLDMGKPVRDSLNLDMNRAVECFAWHAEAIDKFYDQMAPLSENYLGLIRHEPIGVVAAIVPWNFPLVMASWKVAPALATGNSVILKPSERSMLTALRLAGLAKEAGIPDGVFQVLPGFGYTLGKAMALHNDIDCLVFTGSTATGKLLLQYAGQSNMKKVYLECGGKSPHLIFDDGVDIDKAALTAARAIFFNQGEVCVAGSRLLLQKSIKEAVLERVLQHAASMKAGDPLEMTSFMGALVDEAHLKRVLQYIESGICEGAKLLCGGQQVYQDSGGYFVNPTVFDDVTPQMTIFQEEIFGPVLSVCSFDDEDEALRLANNSCFGLAAGVWTADMRRANRLSRKLRAGTVWINSWSGGDMTMPFGGFKQSGNGRDRSLQAMAKYTETKAVWYDFTD